VMWNQQQPPYPYYMGMMPQYTPPQAPLQVLAAFRLLDSLDAKQHPLVAVNDLSIEEIPREKLLPIEEKARATALELLIAFMRSAMQ
jgi:hypothetical protein